LDIRGGVGWMGGGGGGCGVNGIVKIKKTISSEFVRLFFDTLNSVKLLVLRGNQLSKTSTRHRKNLKQSGVEAVDSYDSVSVEVKCQGSKTA